MSIEPRHTALYASAAVDVEKVVKHLPRLTAKSFLVFIWLRGPEWRLSRLSARQSERWPCRPSCASSTLGAAGHLSGPHSAR